MVALLGVVGDFDGDADVAVGDADGDAEVAVGVGDSDGVASLLLLHPARPNAATAAILMTDPAERVIFIRVSPPMKGARMSAPKDTNN